MKLVRQLSTLLLILVLGSSYSAFADNHSEALKSAIADRSDEERKRDKARNPEKTLKFFMVKP